MRRCSVVFRYCRGLPESIRRKAVCPEMLYQSNWSCLKGKKGWLERCCRMLMGKNVCLKLWNGNLRGRKLRVWTPHSKYRQNTGAGQQAEALRRWMGVDVKKEVTKWCSSWRYRVKVCWRNSPLGRRKKKNQQTRTEINGLRYLYLPFIVDSGVLVSI